MSCVIFEEFSSFTAGFLGLAQHFLLHLLPLGNAMYSFFHFCNSKFALRVDHHVELIRGPNKETFLSLSSLRPVRCSHGAVKRKA